MAELGKSNEEKKANEGRHGLHGDGHLRSLHVCCLMMAAGASKHNVLASAGDNLGRWPYTSSILDIFWIFFWISQYIQ